MSARISVLLVDDHAVVREGIRSLLEHCEDIVVVGEADVLDAVDAALWDISSVDFVPHCRADAAPPTLTQSPVLLAETVAAVNRPHAVLINVGASLPAGFERFERLVDVVSANPADRQQGRLRWRHYAERGYVIKPHDFAGAGSE